jgi:hypothetical protein
MSKINDFRVVQCAYNDCSIRIWFSNHNVFEYTLEQVGPSVFNELISLADAGRGLEGYLQSSAVKSYTPRIWKEWLKC